MVSREWLRAGIWFRSGKTCRFIVGTWACLLLRSLVHASALWHGRRELSSPVGNAAIVWQFCRCVRPLFQADTPGRTANCPDGKRVGDTAVSKTSRSTLENTNECSSRACCGWSEEPTQPRSGAVRGCARHSLLAHSAIDVYVSTKEATGIRISESANAPAEQLKSVPA